LKALESKDRDGQDVDMTENNGHDDKHVETEKKYVLPEKTLYKLRYSSPIFISGVMIMVFWFTVLSCGIGLMGALQTNTKFVENELSKGSKEL